MSWSNSIVLRGNRMDRIIRSCSNSTNRVKNSENRLSTKFESCSSSCRTCRRRWTKRMMRLILWIRRMFTLKVGNMIQLRDLKMKRLIWLSSCRVSYLSRSVKSKKLRAYSFKNKNIKELSNKNTKPKWQISNTKATCKNKKSRFSHKVSKHNSRN